MRQKKRPGKIPGSGKILLCFLLINFYPLSADNPVPVLELPFADGDARYFFSADNTIYFGNHQDRTLYRLSDEYKPEKIEDMAGWYILDATLFHNRFIYCSRNRVLYKENNRVVTIEIPGAQNLVSLTNSADELFVLDGKSETSGPSILVCDQNFKVRERFSCPTRNPLDIHWHDGSLWIYDQLDKCVHRFDPKAKKESARIFTGVGHSWSRGILIVNDVLYVHDRVLSSLVPVFWKQVGNITYSCFQRTDYTFLQMTGNQSPTKLVNANFIIPVPADSSRVKYTNWRWSQDPSVQKSDVFGQSLAFFNGIRIAPGVKHSLAYTATVESAAVQYLIEEVPLASLKDIPAEIRQKYLSSDSYFPLDNVDLQRTAKQARLNKNGSEPNGVWGLIENLVTYIIDRLDYTMDDKWESAPMVLANGSGSCSEYSFLFSALARLSGIPTRLVGGFFTDSGSLHRWTEVWYPDTGWVPVDVTRIDADDVASRDWENFFGLPAEQIPLSVIGNPDASDLGVNFYINRIFSGAERESQTDITVQSSDPLESVINIKLTILP